ncbi:PAS domain-containing sensor histidine kinase [Mucilaginibacter pineti]|nr:ATP-binding protein [Mucilaginibacter pineti]
MDDTRNLEEKLAYYQKENEELKLRVEELSDFFENASMPLHWVDAQGIIIWANQAELDALGYSKQEYIGFPIGNFHADQHVIEDILNRLVNNETLYDYTARLKCKDGSIKHVLINSNVMRKDGKFMHTRCFTRDITGKVQEEQRKNDFVTMVSHELKTPLTVINSYVQILINKAKKDADNSSGQLLTRIEAQTKKMIAMVQDFLTPARIEGGKIELRKEAFVLDTLINETAQYAKLLTSKHSINLIADESISVEADRDKIGQILINLLTNAIKYSPKGGAITIGYEKHDEKVRVFVSDQGIGIDKSHHKRLFERFFRVNNELKEVSGFGIGLYLVSEILRLHGSRINLQSEANVGSTFYFDLETLN